jgi:hypothetical protein
MLSAAQYACSSVVLVRTVCERSFLQQRSFHVANGSCLTTYHTIYQATTGGTTDSPGKCSLVVPCKQQQTQSVLQLW